MVLIESTEEVKEYFSKWNIVLYSTFHILNKNFVGQNFAYVLHWEKFGFDVWRFMPTICVKAV